VKIDRNKIIEKFEEIVKNRYYNYIGVKKPSTVISDTFEVKTEDILDRLTKEFHIHYHKTDNPMFTDLSLFTTDEELYQKWYNTITKEEMTPSDSTSVIDVICYDNYLAFSIYNNLKLTAIKLVLVGEIIDDNKEEYIHDKIASYMIDRLFYLYLLPTRNHTNARERFIRELDKTLNKMGIDNMLKDIEAINTLLFATEHLHINGTIYDNIGVYNYGNYGNYKYRKFIDIEPLNTTKYEYVVSNEYIIDTVKDLLDKSSNTHKWYATGWYLIIELSEYTRDDLIRIDNNFSALPSMGIIGRIGTKTYNDKVYVVLEIENTKTGICGDITIGEIEGSEIILKDWENMVLPIINNKLNIALQSQGEGINK